MVLAIAGAVAAGVGLQAASAQESLGSMVTIGGGVSGVGHGDITILQPGVTISGGEVSNSTGIGVLSGGGSSVGASTGGDNSAALLD
jgi:hypothetical protein